MNAWQMEQAEKGKKLSETTNAIAAGLGKPWTAEKPDGDNWQHVITNGDGGKLYVSIEQHGAQRGRVRVSGSLNVGRNGSYESVYENGNRVTSPDITVNPERGMEAIVKEIKRRLLPEYLRILAIAKAQVERHNEKLMAKRAVMARIAKITPGSTLPDFSRDPDSGRVWLGPPHREVVEVLYDCRVKFDRLDVTPEQAEHIIRYLYNTNTTEAK